MSALDDAQGTIAELGDHLADCPDCKVKLDGTGTVCPDGEALEWAAKWDLKARGEELATINREAAALLAWMDNCPAGGEHSRGSSGEWANRCTKCGNPC